MSEKEMKAHQEQRQYLCYGRVHASEREMLLHFLDEYRCAEAFAAEYSGQWINLSGREYVKGGLRTIHQRETFYARLLEARLLALGRSPQCAVPAAREGVHLLHLAGEER